MNTHRVLLIEDDPWVAQVNAEMVHTVAGFEVIGQAGGVQEGWHMVQQLRPDLALIDVFLPDGSGLELLESLRTHGVLLEAVMITAANDWPSVQKALYEGVLDYLIKPFSQARLQESLERYQQRKAVQPHVGSLTQTKLDRMLGFRQQQLLPKGIDATTLEQVRTLLQSTGLALSAEELGERMGLSRVTAWRYLEYLSQVGVVLLELSYGGPGRPVKRYRHRA